MPSMKQNFTIDFHNVSKYDKSYETDMKLTDQYQIDMWN